MTLWHQKAAAGQLPGGVVSGIDQVCFVVEDLDRALEAMTRVLGIGPFKVWTLEAPRLFDTTLDGDSNAWSMRLAVALVGRMQWEVIQPLTGDTSHRRHLTTRYEGLHHLLVANRGHAFDAARESLAQAGYPLIQTARLNLALEVGPITLPAAPDALAASLSTHFGYVESHDALGTTIELAKFPPGISRPLGIRLGKADRFVPPDATQVTATLDTSVFDRVVKLGFVSRDAEATVKAWQSIGVGPWAVGDLGPEDLGEVGIAAGARIRAAWCLLDDVLLEVIEPVAGQTPHARLLAEHGPGLHILGLKSDELEFGLLLDHLRRSGLPILLEGVLHGGYQFAHVDARACHAGVIEVVQLDAAPLFAELQKLPKVRLRETS